MTSKIAARALKYKLESPSYGDSKLQKSKSFKKKIVKPSSSLFYGEWVFLDVAKNGITAKVNDSLTF